LADLAARLGRDPKTALSVPLRIKPGTRLIRAWRGERHQVTVLEHGFEYRGERHVSLSAIARAITGTRWSGPAFFGLKTRRRDNGKSHMVRPAPTGLRCAIYTRKSSEEGLDQAFNSLHAQREAAGTV
jgi:hypothetical protein